jgi:hypothetical protein
MGIGLNREWVKWIGAMGQGMRDNGRESVSGLTWK